MNPSHASPGDVFDRYRIDEVLGVGGMGVVYAATDLRLRRPVALKVISDRLALSEEFRNRFQREAEVLARLDSPHIVQIFDHGEAGGTPFIATQFVGGGDLTGLLASRGRLTVADASRVCAQVAAALHDAHEVGVVHRDVKPANVLVRDPAARDLHTYLCDFGIAQTSQQGGDQPGLTQTGAIAGTWAYLAPERADGHPATPASDIYAVGCLLWACLTGQPPYGGTEIQIAMAHANGPLPRVPDHESAARELNHVLSRTLAKDPGARYADADQLREDLEALSRSAQSSDAYAGSPAAATDSGTRTRRTGPTAPRDAPAGATPVGSGVRGRWWWMAAGAALLALVGAAAFILTRPDDTGKDGGAAPTEPAVAGDLDGDGLGDVLIMQKRFSSGTAQPRISLLSTGIEFGVPDKGDVLDGFANFVADVDGDGANDLVVVDVKYDDGPVLAEVRVDLAQGEAWSWSLPAGDAPGKEVDLGDVDGDGSADLLVFGTTNDDRPTVHVALAGEETFGEVRPWFVGEPDAEKTELSDSYRVVDHDGDGDADVVRLDTDFDGPTVLQVLTSDGRALDAGGDDHRITGPGWELGLESATAGDFDGDGDQELAVIGGRGMTLGVFDVEDGSVVAPATWLDDTGLDFGGKYRALMAADVDGDGDDDLVNLGDPRKGSIKVNVLLSTGSDFEPLAEWGQIVCTPECRDSFDMVWTR